MSARGYAENVIEFPLENCSLKKTWVSKGVKNASRDPCMFFRWAAADESMAPNVANYFIEADLLRYVFKRVKAYVLKSIG